MTIEIREHFNGNEWVFEVWADGKFDSRFWCYDDAYEWADELREREEREQRKTEPFSDFADVYGIDVDDCDTANEVYDRIFAKIGGWNIL